MSKSTSDIALLRKDIADLKKQWNKLKLSRFVNKEFKRHELLKIKKKIAQESSRLSTLINK